MTAAEEPTCQEPTCQEPTCQEPTCQECGRTPQGEPLSTAGVPWTWSTGVAEDGQISWLCDRCAREHARSIEAKLDRDWW